jgi:predicted RNA-binding Zn-ribbon protein involved in translation (DUF1610 family)
MTMTPKPKGSWKQRIGIVLLAALAGVLVFWLLGFVVDDIGALPGPEETVVQKRFLDPQQVAQVEAIDRQITAIEGQIETETRRQTFLRDSTDSSQKTMDQLLELQKQKLQNRVTPSAAEQNALAQAESLFITNQAQYQALNAEIVRRSEEQRSLQRRRKELEAKLDVQRAEASREYERLLRRHRLQTAGLQLAFLVPLLIAAGYLFSKYRNSLYAPLIYAFGIATLAKVALVMHEHFPSRYFKYVLILVLLALVLRLLVHLLRARAFPQMATLLKQYKEAYEHFLCPACDYPIRRGPMRYAVWRRRKVENVAVTDAASAAPEPYACPSCGEQLFEVCTKCNGIRHSLLPFCEVCGTEKPLVPA